ncbi:MAG: tyrosine-type recombinase/integrase [Bacteroidota bacterium]
MAQLHEVPANPTFMDCGTAYVTAMRPGWKNAKHADQWISSLETYAYPVLGELPVDSIDINLVLKVLEPIWIGKTETASRLRGRIEAILDYARVRGYRSGENPARWKGHLDHILPATGDVAKVRHHASLPYARMPAFWPRLQAQHGLGARALELCILTATRTGDVLGARWSEFDMDNRVWEIPGLRMKAGADHRIPLSGPALALLRKLAAIRRGDYVFPGQQATRPLSNMSMAMVLRRMKLDVTPHGFRSTFRTWIAEQTNFPHEVAEAALAHTQGDKVVAAYQRGDLFAKRARLMDAWAVFCETGESPP